MLNSNIGEIISNQLEILSYNHIDGKTYTLFGAGNSTEKYFLRINELVDNIAEICNQGKLFDKLVSASSNKRLLNRWLNNEGSTLMKFIDKSGLGAYLAPIENVQAEFKLNQSCDRTLSANREQHFAFMLMAELANRINKKSFVEADYRIALLPHCLHDLSKNCLSSPKWPEYTCKNCSRQCYIRAVSGILGEFGVEPFIWMRNPLKKMISSLKAKFGSVAVFGIACLPELASGIRKCTRYGIPVMGIPLNANRCVRWMGEFQDNSVDLEQIKKILS